MYVPPINISEIIFRHRVTISKGCYLEENIKNFKDKQVLIRNDYVDDKLISTLIYVSKAGKWLKSKLKVFHDGKRIQTLESRNKNDRMV